MNYIRMFGVLLSITGVTAQGAPLQKEFIQVKKIFHHRADAKNSLGLAKIVFYFDHEPVIKTDSKLVNNIKTDRYFFPMAAGNADIKSLIERFNGTSTPEYKAHIKLLDKPRPGMELQIAYDPKKIAVHYDYFDAITRDKGVLFNLTNLELLSALKSKTQPILRTVKNKMPGVVIDCGHGGTDPGTIGFFGVQEKNITLTVGMQLASLLKDKGFTVFCTRETDVFVPLDERTTQANGFPADLFISLHANHSPQCKTSGVETYCLDMGLFKSGHAINDLMYQTYTAGLCQKSRLLAQSVHQELIECLAKQGTAVVDRQVKNAVSQVLVGAAMPCALIEIGFLSNEAEAARLNENSYQKMVAQGICQGIQRYCDHHYS